MTHQPNPNSDANGKPATDPSPGSNERPNAGNGDLPLNERTLALRVYTMPRDTNPYGTIFGGVILSYVDQAGLVEALRHAPCSWVTASIERVDFKAPVMLGDVVALYTRTTRLGTTSISVAVDVEVDRRGTRETARVTTASLTMVAIGEDGKPTPFRSMTGCRNP